MRTITMTALAFCAMATTAAFADDAATPPAQTCGSMATQVKTALKANQSSSNFADAKKQKEYGDDYCTRMMERTGVEHYARALTLLGASAS